jgi:hypothetical protein
VREEMRQGSSARRSASRWHREERAVVVHADEGEEVRKGQVGVGGERTGGEVGAGVQSGGGGVAGGFVRVVRFGIWTRHYVR